MSEKIPPIVKQVEAHLNKAGLFQNECSCDLCKNMCRRCPCVSTPDEFERIMIEAPEDAIKFRRTFVVDPVRHDLVEILAPEFVNNERCVFLTDEGLCSLHDRGLKPLEGHYASHAVTNRGDLLRSYVLQSWETKRGKSIMAHVTGDYNHD